MEYLPKRRTAVLHARYDASAVSRADAHPAHACGRGGRLSTEPAVRVGGRQAVHRLIHRAGDCQANEARNRADGREDRPSAIHASVNLFPEEGGRLLFGTDVGYLPDHDPRGELAALDACGLGIDDVLAMLTTHPAALFETGSGTVAPREPGDLVLLDKLTTMSDLAAIRATVRAGQVTLGPGDDLTSGRCDRASVGWAMCRTRQFARTEKMI
jgi:hypothetical protein